MTYRASISNIVSLLMSIILVTTCIHESYFWTCCACMPCAPPIAIEAYKSALNACRLFSLLDPSTADVLGLLYMRLWELPVVIAMSCCIGALGSLFIYLNTTAVYKIRNSLIPQNSRYR